MVLDLLSQGLGGNQGKVYKIRSLQLFPYSVQNSGSRAPCRCHCNGQTCELILIIIDMFIIKEFISYFC